MFHLLWKICIAMLMTEETGVWVYENSVMFLQLFCKFKNYYSKIKFYFKNNKNKQFDPPI